MRPVTSPDGAVVNVSCALVTRRKNLSWASANNVAFDWPAFCKKLAADGVAFEAPFRDVPGIELKIAFLIDPAGTRIELTEGLAGR